MNRRAALFLISITAAAAALSIYVLGQSRSQESGPHTTVPAPSASSAARAPPQTHAAPIAKLLPHKTQGAHKELLQQFATRLSIREQPGDVAREARADADAGLPAAMRVLAEALRECARADMGTDEEIEQKIAKRSLGRDLLYPNGTNEHAGSAALEIARMEHVRDSCKQIAPEEAKSWLGVLERAAAAGDSEARASYAWSALAEYTTQDAKEDNAEEYIRRRDEVFGFLVDSVASGDCSNGILNGFRKVTFDDPASAYVYQGLLLRYALVQMSSGNFPPEVVERETKSIKAFLASLASQVPPDQLAAADATSSDILQNYCTTF